MLSFAPIGRFVRLSSLLAALSMAPATLARAEGEMTFAPVGANGIAATGRITERTPQVFVDFLRRSGRADTRPVIYLDSPGGGVIASMQFGTLMRRVGATAIVARAETGFFGGSGIGAAQCFSACVYALIGASKRVVPAESQVGIHGMFLSIDGYGDVTALATRRERSAVGGIRAMLATYSARMGVNPDLIAQAERIPSDTLRILSHAEMRRWRLAQ